jgi:hypothetical protein
MPAGGNHDDLGHSLLHTKHISATTLIKNAIAVGGVAAHRSDRLDQTKHGLTLQLRLSDK